MQIPGYQELEGAASFAVTPSLACLHGEGEDVVGALQSSPGSRNQSAGTEGVSGRSH